MLSCELTQIRDIKEMGLIKPQHESLCFCQWRYRGGALDFPGDLFRHVQCHSFHVRDGIYGSHVRWTISLGLGICISQIPTIRQLWFTCDRMASWHGFYQLGMRTADPRLVCLSNCRLRNPWLGDESAHDRCGDIINPCQHTWHSTHANA